MVVPTLLANSRHQLEQKLSNFSIFPTALFQLHVSTDGDPVTNSNQTCVIEKF